MTKILAIGNSSTYESDTYKAVADVLAEQGHEALLFRQDLCLKGEYMTYSVKGGRPRYGLIVDGHDHDAKDFGSVWYMHPRLPKELLAHEMVEHRPFIQRQFDGLRQGLWHVLRGKTWLNDPLALQAAENKVHQMEAATGLFAMPDTVITSDPAAVRTFYAEHGGRIVVKMLATSPMLDRVVYTNVVTKRHMELIDSVRQSPSIFQELVPKAYELRITVVGDRMFPVKIHSQGDAVTAIDWRRKPKLNDFEVKMEQAKLPAVVAGAIRTYMARMGLRFGCIDMIVRPDGQHVFLEVNPAGQWYFVQLRTGAEIGRAIASLLA